MLFNPKTTPVSLADTKLTWCSIYILFRSSKSTGNINTYCKFLLFLITRFSKYICNQVPVKATATFIYLNYNTMCLFCKISNDCVKVSLLFCLLLLTFLFMAPTKVNSYSLVEIYPFPIHHHSHCLQPWKNSYSFTLTLVHFQIHCHCQTILSLFSSQHSLFLLLLPPPHYQIQHFSSFCQISLKQRHYLILHHQKGFVPFLQLPAERSITTWPVTEGTTVTLKLFSD